LSMALAICRSTSRTVMPLRWAISVKNEKGLALVAGHCSERLFEPAFEVRIDIVRHGCCPSRTPHRPRKAVWAGGADGRAVGPRRRARARAATQWRIPAPSRDCGPPLQPQKGATPTPLCLGQAPPGSRFNNRESTRRPLCSKFNVSVPAARGPPGGQS
jgi:hypothetical protein